MSGSKAIIAEIFSSVQGEGVFVGCRQIFIRFYGCNLNCRFCDTQPDRTPEYCRCETAPGKGKFDLLPNPLSIEQVADRVKLLDPVRHHSISLTGGEPLLHAAFIKQLIPVLLPARMGIYLESNGTLPQELARIVDSINIVAMDIKLPGTACVRPLWPEHREFLNLALKKQAMVKIIADNNSADQEIDQAIDLIHQTGEVPVIIQPVTSPQGVPLLTPERALAIQARAMEKIKDVRVIPQTHKYMLLP